MGYRSDVAIAFYTRKPDKGRAAVVKLWLQQQGVLNDEDGDYDFVTDRGVIVQFKDVKWYPTYSDVQRWMDTYYKFEAEFCENPSHNDDEYLYACEFVRIGEETDDVERMSSDMNEWVLSVSRSICVDL